MIIYAGSRRDTIRCRKSAVAVAVSEDVLYEGVSRQRSDSTAGGFVLAFRQQQSTSLA